jgi:hypothetical protein
MENVEKPSPVPRGDHGHLIPGAKLALGAGFKHTVRKSLGRKHPVSQESKIVTRDANRLFSEILPVLASDAPPVRALLAVYARHHALNAYYTDKAEEAGLDTTLGLQYLEIADRQSQRCERVLVTCHDLAKVHAAAKASVPFDPCPIVPALPSADALRTVEMPVVDEG